MTAAEGSRGAPLALWFATLGGAVAWAVHLLLVWLLEEAVVCGAAGTDQLAGISATAMITLLTVAPGVVSVAAAWLAWRFWLATRASGGDPSVERANFMALLGIVSNLLFLLIIVYDGIALLVFRPCLT